MKKYLAVLIASLLIILAGCGPENGTAEQTTKAASLNAISADEIDTTVGKSDQDAAYDESKMCIRDSFIEADFIVTIPAL